MNACLSKLNLLHLLPIAKEISSPSDERSVCSSITVKSCSSPQILFCCSFSLLPITTVSSSNYVFQKHLCTFRTFLYFAINRIEADTILYLEYGIWSMELSVFSYILTEGEDTLRKTVPLYQSIDLTLPSRPCLRDNSRFILF